MEASMNSKMPSQSFVPDDADIDVGHYRRLVSKFFDMRRYRTALFWAEKVCVLSGNYPKDTYIMAQCMFMLKDYHTVVHTLLLHEMEKTYLSCYNLLLEALYASQQFEKAKGFCIDIDVDLLTMSLQRQSPDELESSTFFGDEEEIRKELLATSIFLKGKIYEALNQQGQAMDYYVEALNTSVTLYESMQALVQNEMLIGFEETELLQHLPLVQQTTQADAELILKLYETQLRKNYKSASRDSIIVENPIANFSAFEMIQEKTENLQWSNVPDGALLNSLKFLKISTPTKTLTPIPLLLEKYRTPFSLKLTPTPCRNASVFSSLFKSSERARSHKNAGKEAVPLKVCLERIQMSTDMMAAKAEQLYYDRQTMQCYKILEDLLKINPYDSVGLILQIGCLVETEDFNKLFCLANELIDKYPDKPVSWYAVGCYYNFIGKLTHARTFLSKALSLDRQYGPALLTYGHSFTQPREHDQAMSAYITANQFMRGCYLPLLYIGIEFRLMNNFEVAEKFLYQALVIAPLDIFVLYELGMIRYAIGCYESCEEIFSSIAEFVTKRSKMNNQAVSEHWAPLFNSLGYCYRKNDKLEKALEYHKYALDLKPFSAETYTAIGFVYSLIGNLKEAISYFHKSLALNADCVFTTTMLDTCLKDLVNDEDTINEICGTTSTTFDRIISSIDDFPCCSTALRTGKAIRAKFLPPTEGLVRKRSHKKLEFDESLPVEATSDEEPIV